MDSKREISMESINYDYENNNYLTFSDLESANGNPSESILRISNSKEYKINQRKKIDNYLNCCLNSCIIYFLLSLPIIICICEIYYAFSDTSCVNLKNKNININLYIYLLVDAIYGIVISFVVSLYVCFHKKYNLLNNSITNIIIYIVLLFNLSWVIVGAIVFWKISTDYNCNGDIYSFVFIELIIKILFLFLIIIKLTH
jgi:hypothetical protein